MQLASLRVVFVSDAITSRNGVGTYYQDLVSHLSEYIEHAELIAPSMNDRDKHRGVSFPIPGDTTQRLYFPKFRSLPALLRELKPHVIVFPTLGPYTLFGVRHARRMGIPICVSKHTDFEKMADLYCGRLAAAVFQRVVRWMNTRMLESSSVIVTNDHQDRQRFNGVAPVRVVGTPVSKLFLNTEIVPPSENLNTILFVGRLGPEKNIDKIIEVAQQMPSIDFLIAGDGPLRSAVEREADQRGNFKYLGWLDRPQVVDTIDRADLLILPSRLESFGSVALEAMSRARNVLVSRDCGIGNWPVLAEKLFYWEAGEPLAEAIQRVARLHPPARVQRANQCRQASLSVNASAVNDWLSVLNELVNGRAAPARLSMNRAS